MTNDAPAAKATPEQAAVIPTQVGMRMVHQSNIQLRVDAMSLAVQVHDKTRWSDKETTSEQYDEQLVASARAIHAFLTEA